MRLMCLSNMHCNARNVQVLLVGGLFERFTFSESTGYVKLNRRAVSSMAAVQMAINDINNKYDGKYDDLLPQTKVCCE